MKLSTAIDGYFLDAMAGRLSPNTITSYRVFLRHLQEYLQDKEIEAVTHDDLARFMSYLRTEYKMDFKDAPLSDSSLDNHWKAARSLFKWADEFLNVPRPDLKMPRPRYRPPEIEPYNPDEIKAILASLERTRIAQTSNRAEFSMKRPTAMRDKLVVLMLLDTGLRIGELCRLRIQDVDLETGEIFVRAYGTGRKTKSRYVYIGKTARRLAWLYLVRIRKEYDPEDPFIPHPKDTLQSVFRRLKEKTGLGIYPHRFRHTFAISFLRNGGDVFTLQRLLGHSTLDMVKRYLAIADSDSAAAHRRASPVDNLKL